MIAIVKYNAGNTRSVLCALHRLGYEAVVTDDPEELRKAEKVIFPGVGEASTAMAYLREKGLDTILTSLSQPFLGICLGLQLMCETSEEHNTRTLGIFPIATRKFTLEAEFKIPHMGWNTVDYLDDPLFSHLQGESWCYFVHSYYVPLCEATIATTTYGGQTFSSVLHKENYYGCQFHPEKSGDVGEKILKAFLEDL